MHVDYCAFTGRKSLPGLRSRNFDDRYGFEVHEACLTPAQRKRIGLPKRVKGSPDALAPITAAECSHFVANRDGSYTCEPCLTPKERKRMGDEDVEVWEVGSVGWTSDRIFCNRCTRRIDVVADAESQGSPEIRSIERQAEERGLVAVWEDDCEEYQLGDAETERPRYVLNCLVYRAGDLDSHGSPKRGARPLACMGGIGVIDDSRESDDYKRSTARELLGEALAELDKEDAAEAEKLAARATYAGGPQ